MNRSILLVALCAVATACASTGPLDATYYPGVEPALHDQRRGGPAVASSAQARAPQE